MTQPDSGERRPPLQGLRVIELCSFVAGPLAGMLLAQQGADVIRVDPIGGAADYRRLPRSADGVSIYWTGLNKNKRSVTLDLRSQEGRDLVRRLVGAPGRSAGILLTNAVGASWLDMEALRAVRDDVIKVHIQGHPEGGPAVDYTVNAATGFPLITGPQRWAGPVNHVLPAWDVLTGSLAANAVLAAERRRLLDGGGDLVQVALSDVALAMAGNLGYLAEAETLNRDRDRTGNDIYGTYGAEFATGDGQSVMVAAITRRQWSALLDATSTAEALTQLAATLGMDFEEEADRYAAREAVSGVLAPWFAARTIAEISEAFDGRAVLWSRYRTFRDVVAALQNSPAESAIFDTISQPGVGTFQAPRSPLRSVGGQSVPVVPAPQLGQHTRQVLTSVLGVSAPEWEALVGARVVEGSP